MVFQEYGENQPTNHTSDCYFCMVDPSRCRSGKMLLPLNIRIFLLRLLQLFILISFPYQFLLHITNSRLVNLLLKIQNEDYTLNPELEERKPYCPNQQDLNDPIRDLGLTKSNPLKQLNLLDDSVHVTEQCKRHQNFLCFITMQEGVCFFNSVSGLFESIGIPCNPSHWRLFIDSSSKSLKAVLLHNGN